jgi:hypothetical protein
MVLQFSQKANELKELKNGTSIYITNYSVKVNKDNQFDVMEDIQKFATHKSHGMAKHPDLMDKVINLAVEFSNGTWVSCAFVSAGIDIDITNCDEELSGRGNIVSFKMTFF